MAAATLGTMFSNTMAMVFISLAVAQVPTSMDTDMYEAPVTIIFYQPLPGSVIDHVIDGKALIEIHVQGLEEGRHVEIMRNGKKLHR